MHPHPAFSFAVSLWLKVCLLFSPDRRATCVQKLCKAALCFGRHPRNGCWVLLWSCSWWFSNAEDALQQFMPLFLPFPRHLEAAFQKVLLLSLLCFAFLTDRQAIQVTLW